MATLGFYFPLDNEAANRMRGDLNKIAKGLGYLAKRGPTAGDGNLAAMLIALSKGELKVVKVDDDKRNA